jgi:hypothetical protein
VIVTVGGRYASAYGLPRRLPAGWMVWEEWPTWVQVRCDGTVRPLISPATPALRGSVADPEAGRDT